MLDDTRIQYFADLSDQNLVSLLLAADSDAWEYIFLKVVLPVVRSSTGNGTSYRSILQDKALDEQDVWSDLYTDMIIKNKLALYRYRCPVIYWMRYYVMNIVLGYCKKIPTHLSDECLKYVSISKPPLQESAEVDELSFAELWRENPMRAYVFLLKYQDCYSSEEIKNCLGMTSANNVDQFFARAKKDMESLIHKYSGDMR